MNKLDAVILFATDGNQPKSGLALFSIPHGRDLLLSPVKIPTEPSIRIFSFVSSIELKRIA